MIWSLRECAVEELKPIDEAKLATFQDAIVKINEELAALARPLNEPEEGEGIPQEVETPTQQENQEIEKSVQGRNCRGFLDEEWNCGLCFERRARLQYNRCRRESSMSTGRCGKCEGTLTIHEAMSKFLRHISDGGCNQMFCTSCHTAFDRNTTLNCDHSDSQSTLFRVATTNWA